MNRRKKKLYTKTIILKRSIMRFAILIFFLILIAGYSGKAISNFLTTDIHKLCLYQNIPAISAKRKKNYLNTNSIKTVSMAMPILKSNEDLNKKYATRYSFIKEKEDAPTQEETYISENILELDLSTSQITFTNPTNYSVDAQTLLNAPLSISPPDNSPRVLIVHTHTSEAYSESPGARSQDNEKNVVKVGAKIAEILNKNGIVTIHDSTQNDSPSYNGSYKKCLATVEKNLATYPTIEIVLDIHRDYLERDACQLKPTAVTDKGKAAQIMFVVGTDAMGLFHPDWRENLSLAVKMQNTLLDSCPKLCRHINIRTERFNQHTTKGSMIIEVGSSANTVDEATLSGEYIASALSDILKKQ